MTVGFTWTGFTGAAAAPAAGLAAGTEPELEETLVLELVVVVEVIARRSEEEEEVVPEVTDEREVDEPDADTAADLVVSVPVLEVLLYEELDDEVEEVRAGVPDAVEEDCLLGVVVVLRETAVELLVREVLAEVLVLDVAVLEEDVLEVRVGVLVEVRVWVEDEALDVLDGVLEVVAAVLEVRAGVLVEVRVWVEDEALDVLDGVLEVVAAVLEVLDGVPVDEVVEVLLDVPDEVRDCAFSPD